jgi:peroxiredoxin Q/BCP
MALFGTSVTLKVGDRAPDFSLPDQNGKMVKLADFHGKKTVILAFYPKASTPG